MKGKHYLLGVFIIIIDQISKQLAINKYLTIIPNALNITYTQNTGAAFGIGRLKFVTALSILIVFGIIIICIKEKKYVTSYIPYVFILSGAAANLADRLFRGYVIDYIDIKTFNFPNFNIADICITIGVIFLIGEIFMKKEKSCGCIIFDKASHSQVLIVYEKGPRFWGFPKGHIEEGETEEQTALREVKEEVGIDVKILDEKYRYEINYIIKDKQIDKTSVFYLAETVDENITTKNQETEIEDSKWVTVEEAFDILTFDNNKKVLRKAWKDIKKKGN